MKTPRIKKRVKRDEIKDHFEPIIANQILHEIYGSNTARIVKHISGKRVWVSYKTFKNDPWNGYIEVDTNHVFKEK